MATCNGLQMVMYIICITVCQLAGSQDGEDSFRYLGRGFNPFVANILDGPASSG